MKAQFFLPSVDGDLNEGKPPINVTTTTPRSPPKRQRTYTDPPTADSTLQALANFPMNKRRANNKEEL